MKHVCVIPGDGIGPEVISSAVEVLEAVSSEFSFEYASAGLAEFRKIGMGISDDTLRMMKDSDSTLFGAVTSPQDKEYRSPVLSFRKELDLFANVRPVKSIYQIAGRERTDIVIVRENTEGMYTQDEVMDDSGVITRRRITPRACERIIRYAFERTPSWGKHHVCCVHKANVLRRSDGLFLDIFHEIGHQYAGKIRASDQLVDSAAMHLVTEPSRFEVMVTLNLYGDILSDVAAGMVGGLGFAPSGNIGLKHSVFEPCHGSAPDIAGRGVANPTAAVLAAAMMLEHLDMHKQSKMVRDAVIQAYSNGHSTRDIGGSEGTSEFTKSIIDAISSG